MRKKRIFSAFTALLAAVCVMWFYGGYGGMPRLDTLASADTELNGIGLSRSRVKFRDNFDILVHVPAVNLRADTVEFRIHFDPSVFEAVSWSTPVSGADVNIDNANGYLYHVFSSSSAVVDLSNGLDVSVKMKAKSGVSTGNYTFTLLRGMVSNYDMMYRWQPETTSAEIKLVSSLVSLSGKITTKTAAQSATVTLTDTNGVKLETSAQFTYNSRTGFYEAEYKFSELEVGESYVMETIMPGFASRTEQVSPTGASTQTLDMSVNKPGDVDSDGEITANDATQVLKYLAGLPCVLTDGTEKSNSYLVSVAHVGSGSSLSITDATQILRYLAGRSSVLGSIQG